MKKAHCAPSLVIVWLRSSQLALPRLSYKRYLLLRSFLFTSSELHPYHLRRQFAASVTQGRRGDFGLNSSITAVPARCAALHNGRRDADLPPHSSQRCGRLPPYHSPACASGEQSAADEAPGSRRQSTRGTNDAAPRLRSYDTERTTAASQRARTTRFPHRGRPRRAPRAPGAATVASTAAARAAPLPPFAPR